MNRTRVKICGVTRLEDALLACELGADAIGLVMTPSSPRCVPLDRARAIRHALPSFVSAVAVVVNPDASYVEELVSVVAPDFLQFHGQESPEFCVSFGRRYIKAFSMNECTDAPGPGIACYGSAAAVLLDGRVPQEAIDGRAFDWNDVPKILSRPLILAGGLDETNIVSAIRQLGPYAVDVSSGVETAPGIKDRAKLERLFRALSDADRHGRKKEH